jgi:hypothetical protein
MRPSVNGVRGRPLAAAPAAAAFRTVQNLIRATKTPPATIDSAAFLLHPFFSLAQ